MRFRQLAALSAAVTLVGAAAVIRAEEPRGAASRDGALARSVGSPTDGALVGGVALRERAELRLRWPDGPRWALPPLVTMLERAAERVGRRFPGSILLVGDLSRREGGAIGGHLSHESGRDADVGFYYSDARGRAVRTDHLLAVGDLGNVPAAATLRFDEARNWELVQAFLSDPEASVQRIFLAAPLKRLLLDYARRHDAAPNVVERAERAIHQPSRGNPHDDHFHVRIACPPDEGDECIGDPPSRASRERTASLEPSER